MNIGSGISIILTIIVAYGVFRVWKNDVKHLQDNVKKIWGKLDEVEKDIKINSVDIGKLQGKLNNK